MKSSNTTIPLEKLLEQLPENFSVADRELVQRAYRVAEEAHREQKRISGEPYINHGITSSVKHKSTKLSYRLRYSRSKFVSNSKARNADQINQTN